MERDTHLSESKRITRLLEVMTTAKGKDVVQQAMGGSYDEVVTLLLECFDQPNIVYRYHLQSLLDLQTIEDDYNSVVAFRQTIQQHHQGLRAMEELPMNMFWLASLLHSCQA